MGSSGGTIRPWTDSLKNRRAFSAWSSATLRTPKSILVELGMSYFVSVHDDAGRLTSFINLDQVRMITDISPDGCKVHLGANFTAIINGAESVKQFLMLVAKYSAASEPSNETTSVPPVSPAG